MKKDTTVILALFPNVVGLGYVCLENPQTLLKAGIMQVRPMSNKKALNHVKDLVGIFNPKIVILRDFDTHKPRTRKKNTSAHFSTRANKSGTYSSCMAQHQSMKYRNKLLLGFRHLLTAHQRNVNRGYRKIPKWEFLMQWRWRLRMNT